LVRGEVNGELLVVNGEYKCRKKRHWEILFFVCVSDCFDLCGWWKKTPTTACCFLLNTCQGGKEAPGDFVFLLA